MSELDKEWQTLTIAFELTLKVTKKYDLLMSDEAPWKEKQVDANLTAGEYQFEGLKLPVKLQLLRQHD